MDRRASADGEVSERSYAAFPPDALDRLAMLAERDAEAFFTRYPDLAAYRRRRLGVFLAQGGAGHYAGLGNGVKDLDVWTFYERVPGLRQLHPKRIVSVDFGPSVFGRHPHHGTHCTGRKVDLMMRSIGRAHEDQVASVLAWLRDDPNKSPQELRRKPLVVIEPVNRRGEIAWRPS